MRVERAKLNDALGLTDDDYWSAPIGTMEAVFDRLSTEQMQGVLLGAPAQVSLDKRATIPLVAYRAGSYRDVRTLEFQKHAVLVAVDLDRNVVHAASAVALNNPPGSVGSANSVPIPDGYIASPFVIDARDRLVLPWNPASYVFTIIMRDRVSNRVRVTLGKSSEGFQDEAVAKFIAEQRAKHHPIVISPLPGDPLPCYQPSADSPELPQKDGVLLKVERVLLLQNGTHWMLHGAFRLPALPQELVVPHEEEKDGKQSAPPTAVIGIALLIVGADTGQPTLIRLRAPSYDPVDSKSKTATGYFSMDLLQEAPHLANVPQTYFIYAISGETFAAPVPSALVPESWLRMG